MTKLEKYVFKQLLRVINEADIIVYRGEEHEADLTLEKLKESISQAKELCEVLDETTR